MAINDINRKQWIDNDEGLYDLWRFSGLSKTKFIKKNKQIIDEVINNIKSGKKQAHYLKYG